MKSFGVTLFAGFLASAPLWAQDLPVDPAFAQAAEAIEDNDFGTATELMAESDSLTRDLVLWMQYRAGEGSFAEMAEFVETHPAWPGLDSIRTKAEGAIDETTPASDIIAFFEGEVVDTGKGAVAYANALISQGRRADAEAMLVNLWRTSAFTNTSHQAIINAFPEVVEPHHVERADMLLWRWRTTDAGNVVSHLDEGHQALVRARIANITRSGDIAAREALVPDRLQNDPGLHYDRFNRRAERGDWTEAVTILSNRSITAEKLGVPWRWGSWRRTLARWQMREGNIATAYRLASVHFIEPDEDNYDDLEWLSGYIALTYMRDYQTALKHFQNFDASVSSPISKGRAGYWLGRAYEGLGDAEAAVLSFQMGAEHQTSFYGLLSAEHLGLSLDPKIAGGEDFGDWRTSPMLQNDLVRAGLTLLDAGERGLAVLFLRDAAASMSREHVGQLGALLMDIDEPFFTVLIAKTAVREDQIVHDAYFPIHPMAELDLPVEPALALAIARQESEFRVDAGSGVGALGLMQLMPPTAREVAGWIDLPFSRARLTTDWEYNAALGSEYLAYLTREFGNAPVMIAAGYNAGPSRPKEWMTERGDPRRSMLNPDQVNVIDWIEHIPFRETRNYVMRVTEGIPVYRARLTGEVGPVKFTDILVGTAPVIRPVSRPPADAPSITAAEEIAPVVDEDIGPVLEEDLDPVMEEIAEPVIEAPVTRPSARDVGDLVPLAPSGPPSIRPVARAGD